jgi:hypothetical protein
MGIFNKKKEAPLVVEPAIVQEPKVYDPTQGAPAKEEFLERKNRLLNDERFTTANDINKKKYLEKFHDIYGNKYLNQIGVKDTNLINEYKSKFVEDTFRQQAGTPPKKKEETGLADIPSIHTPLPDWLKDSNYSFKPSFHASDNTRVVPSTTPELDALVIKHKTDLNERLPKIYEDVINLPEFGYVKSTPGFALRMGEDFAKDLDKYLKKDKTFSYNDRQEIENYFAGRTEQGLIEDLRKKIDPITLKKEVDAAAVPYVEAEKGTFLDPETGERRNKAQNDDQASYQSLLFKSQNELVNEMLGASVDNPYANKKTKLEEEQAKLEQESSALKIERNLVDSLGKSMPAPQYLNEVTKTLQAEQKAIADQKLLLEKDPRITQEQIDIFNKTVEDFTKKHEDYRKQMADYNKVVTEKGPEYQKKVDEYNKKYDEFVKKSEQFDQAIEDFNTSIKKDSAKVVDVKNPTTQEKLTTYVNDAHLQVKYWQEQFNSIGRQIRGEEPALSQEGLLEARKQAGMKLYEAKAKFEAGVKMLYNNEGIADVEKDAKYMWEVFGKGFGQSLLGPELMSYDKPSQQEILQKMGQIAVGMDVKLTPMEKENLQTNLAEMVYGGLGGLIPDMALMYAAGPVFNALKIPTKGVKIITNPVMKEMVSPGKFKTAKAVIGINDPVPMGWNVLKEMKATPIQTAKATIANIAMAEATFQSLYGMEPGAATGFEIAHIFNPKALRFKGRLQALNPLLSLATSGIGPTIGMESAKVTGGIGQAILTDKPTKQIFDELYPSVGESAKNIMAELIMNTLFFGTVNVFGTSIAKQNTAPVGGKYNRFGQADWYAYMSPKYRSDVYKAAQEFEKMGRSESAQYIYQWLDATKDVTTAQQMKDVRMKSLSMIYEVLPIGQVRQMRDMHEAAILMLESQSRNPDFKGELKIPIFKAEDIKKGNIISAPRPIEVDPTKGISYVAEATDPKTGRSYGGTSYYEVFDIVKDQSGRTTSIKGRDVETGVSRSFTRDKEGKFGIDADITYKLKSPLEIMGQLENAYENIKVIDQVIAARGRYGDQFKLQEGPKAPTGLPEASGIRFGEMPEQPKEKEKPAITKYQQKLDEVEARRKEMAKERQAPPKEEWIPMPYRPFGAPERILETRGGEFLSKYQAEQKRIGNRVEGLIIDNEQLEAEKKTFKGILNLKQKKRIKEIDDQISRNQLLIDQANATFGATEGEFMDQIRPAVMEEIKNVLPDVTDDEMPTILNTVWAMMTEPNPGEDKLTVKNIVSKAINDLMGEAAEMQKPEPIGEPKKEEPVIEEKPEEKPVKKNVIYTNQINENFLQGKKKGDVVYFSNDPEYFKTNEGKTYEASINTENVVDLRELQKELGRAYDPEELTNYEIHDQLIQAILGKGKSPVLQTIIRDAFAKGGEKLADEVLNRLKKADIIIGTESTFSKTPITTYAVINPESIAVKGQEKPAEPEYPQINFDKIAENGLNYNTDVVDGKPVINYKEWKITYEDGTTVVVPTSEYNRQERIWNEESGIKPMTPEEEKQVEETVQAEKDRKVSLNNRLVGYVEDYNATPRNKKLLRQQKRQAILKAAQEIGYSISEKHGKIIVTNDNGSKIRRIGVKGEYETVGSIKDQGLKDFVKTILDAKEYLIGIDAPSMGPVGLKQSIETLLSGKATAQSQYLLDALKDMYNKGVMRFKENEGPEGISVKELLDQINNDKFVNFINKNGVFGLETLDAAVKVGIIEPDEVEFYKKAIEDENESRIRIEQEWADEQARIVEEQLSGTSAELPTAESQGEEDQGPEIRRMAVEMLRDKIIEAKEIQQVINISRNLIKSAVARGVPKFRDIIAELMLNQSVSTMEEVLGSLKGGYEIEYKNANAEQRAKMDIVEARGFDKGSLYELIGKQHKPEGEDKFKDIVGKKFYATATHTEFEIDRIELWKDPRDRQIESMGGMFATLPEEFEKQYVAIVKQHALEGGPAKYIPVDVIRGLIESGKLAEVIPYDNAEYNKGINDVMDIYMGINDLEKIYTLEELKKKKPNREIKEALESLKRLADGAKYQNDILAGRILPDPIKVETPRGIGDIYDIIDGMSKQGPLSPFIKSHVPDATIQKLADILNEIDKIHAALGFSRGQVSDIYYLRDKLIASPAIATLYRVGSKARDLVNGVREGSQEKVDIEVARVDVEIKKSLKELDQVRKYALTWHLKYALWNREDLGNIKTLERIAEKYGVTRENYGPRLRDVIREQTELAIVEVSRAMAQDMRLTDKDKFIAILNLYESLPTLAIRSGEGKELQQYSSPPPLGFIMGQFVHGNNVNYLLEPMGGNGSLLINTRRLSVRTNDLDYDRYKNLISQGYNAQHANTMGGVTNLFDINQFDAVLINPPFTGAKAKYEGWELREDQVAILANLSHLKDDGKAAFILGDNVQFKKNGQMEDSFLKFFNYLESHYNVADIINIDGNLYGKMGTKYDIYMVLIDGRKAHKEGVARLRNDSFKPESNWNNIYERVNNLISKPNGSTILQQGLVPNGGISSLLGGSGTIIKGGKNRFRSDVLSPGTGYGLDEAGGTPLPERPDARPSRIGPGRQVTRPGGSSGQFSRIPPATGSTNTPGGGPSTGGRFGNIPPSSTPEDLPVSNIGKPDEGTLRNIPLAERTGDESTVYIPISKGKDGNYVVPASIALELKDYMRQLYEEVGDFDTFAVEKLKLQNLTQLYQYYNAQQIESIVQGIYNAERDNAMIIGHQAGAGKGRIGAGMIRYARENGMTPVFITQKSDLFNDMYRDLYATGSGYYKPFLVNKTVASGNKILTVYHPETGEILHQADLKLYEKIIGSGKFELPENIDVVMATYSQFNTDEGGAQNRRNFLMSLAERKDVLFILDESHSASGMSNTGEFFMVWIRTTKGGMYLSATWAKRPDNLPLYVIKTVLTEANISFEDLIETVQSGGVALQEMITSQLAESGQFSRIGFRMDAETHYLILGDDDPTQKTFNPEAGKEIRKKFDQATSILREIIEFQRDHINPILEGMNDEIKAKGRQVTERKGTTKAGIKNHPYFSRVTNILDQLLFAIKVKDSIPLILESLKAGRKPVIGFKNTMEALFNDMVERGELEKGMEIPMDFSEVFKRGMRTIMSYTEIDEQGISGKKVLDPADLPPSSNKAYYALLDKVRAMSIGIPSSPIDALHDAIRKAGYKTLEVTGRNTMFELNADGTRGKYVINDKPDKIEAIKLFNNNPGYALFLNASGSTGLSAHSDPNFRDTSQREFFGEQNDFDINVVIQLLFRINRFGQLNKPVYNFLTTTIPAEMRFFMMTAKKLESLDANTTGSQGHSKNLINHPNYFNKYGDAVVVEMLREDPSFNELIGDPLGLNEPKPDTSDAVYEVMKRVQILSIADQEGFLNSLKDRYEQEIEYLNSTGQNDLAMTSENLNAEFKSSEMVIQGNGGENAKSVFGDDTILNVAEVDVLRKPLTAKEIDETLGKLDLLPAETHPDYSLRRLKEIQDGLSKRYDAEANKLREDSYARLAEIREKIYGEAKGTLEDQRRKDEDESKKIDDHLKFRLDTLAEHYGAINNQFRKYFEYFYPGRVVEIPFTESDQLDLIRMNKGIFLDFDVNMSKPNPYAPSNVFLRFATTDSRRVFRIPVSKAAHLDSIIANSYHIGRDERMRIREQWDTIRPSKQREIRYIITGNVLQGMGTYKKGRLITFTKKEGTVDKGILMPENWIKPDANRLRMPISRAFDIIKALRPGSFVESVTGDITIKKIWDTPDQLFDIMVPESKARGYKFYSDAKLKTLIEGEFWEKHGDRMIAQFYGENLKEVLDYLDTQWNIQLEVDNKKVQQGMNQTDAENMMSDLADTAISATVVKNRGGLTNPASMEPIASRRRKMPDRIGPSPIFNETPKPVWQIAKEFFDAMNTTLYNMKRPSSRGKAIGAYFSGIGRVGTKWLWDMRVWTHEAGHFLDDVFGLVGPESMSRRSEFQRELKELSAFGSTPPGSASDEQKAQYILGEGVAEWFRAYVHNPQETETKYPNFSRWFHERIKVNETAQKAIDELSHQIRVWYGASEGVRQQLQINYGETEEQLKLMNQKFGDKFKREIGGQFQFTPFDHYNNSIVNMYHYSEEAYKWLMSLQGVSDVMDPTKLDPNQNYMIVLKQWLGFNLKADDWIKNGFTDFNGNRIIDEKTKKPRGLGLLLEQLPQDTMDRMYEHMNEAFKYGVAERTVEVVWKLQAWKIEEDLSASGNHLPPKHILAKHPYRYDLHKAKIESILEKIEDGDMKEEDVFLPEERYDFTNEIITGVAQEFTLTDYQQAINIKAEFEEMEKIDPFKHNWISEFNRIYRAIGDDNGRYLLDSGFISQKQFEQYQAENLFFIMFSRVNEYKPGDILLNQEDKKDIFNPFGNNTAGSGGLLNPRITLKKVQGSRKTIEHPLYAALERWIRITQVADQNYLTQTFALPFKKNREFYSAEVGDTGYNKSASIGWISDTWEPNSLAFRVEGKHKYLVISIPELYESIKLPLTAGLQNSWVWKLAIAAPQVFRKTIITAIPFMLRNIKKDIGKFFTIGHAIRYWRPWDLLPNKKLKEQYIIGGGGLFGYMEKSKIAYQRSVKEAIFLLSKEPWKIITHPSIAFKTFKDYTQSYLLNSETIVRFKFAFMAAYREGKKKYKMSDSQATSWAVYHSRNLLDHAVKGTAIKQINQLIPFIAPSIGGIRADWQALKKHPGRVSVGLFFTEILPVVGVIMALYLLYKKSTNPSLTEEERIKAKIKLDEYDKMPWYQKDLFLNFPVSDGWVSIPRQYDIGLIATWLERILYGAVVKPSITEFGDTANVAQRIGPLFFHNPGAGIGYVSPINEESLYTGFKGFSHISSKEDKFRGRYIIPPDEQQKAIVSRITEGASPLGQGIQKLSDYLTPFEKNHYVIDARMADDFIESQFTYYGRWAKQASEYIFRDSVRPQYKFKLVDLLGMYKYAPAFNSPDVKWLQGWLAEFKDTNVMKQMPFKEAFTGLSKIYIMSMNDPEKSAVAAYNLRVYAAKVRHVMKDIDMYNIAASEAFLKKVKMGVFTPSDLEKMK